MDRVFYIFYGSDYSGLELPFCGSNLTDHYCCAMQPLCKLECCIFIGDVTGGDWQWGALCCSVIILVTSYIVLLHSLQSHIAEGRKKALSTCTFHVIVAVLSFGPCVFIYTQPPTTLPTDKMVEVFYTTGTPFLNPLILHTEECRSEKCHEKLWHVRITSESKRWILAWIDYLLSHGFSESVQIIIYDNAWLLWE